MKFSRVLSIRDGCVNNFGITRYDRPSAISRPSSFSVSISQPITLDLSNNPSHSRPRAR